jgi:hypothetical protein
MPGKGFFELAEELGYDISDDSLFWAEQLKRVFSEHSDYKNRINRRVSGS